MTSAMRLGFESQLDVDAIALFNYRFETTLFEAVTQPYKKISPP